MVSNFVFQIYKYLLFLSKAITLFSNILFVNKYLARPVIIAQDMIDRVITNKLKINTFEASIL